MRMPGLDSVFPSQTGSVALPITANVAQCWADRVRLCLNSGDIAPIWTCLVTTEAPGWLLDVNNAWKILGDAICGLFVCIEAQYVLINAPLSSYKKLQEITQCNRQLICHALICFQSVRVGMFLPNHKLTWFEVSDHKTKMAAWPFFVQSPPPPLQCAGAFRRLYWTSLSD